MKKVFFAVTAVLFLTVSAQAQDNTSVPAKTEDAKASMIYSWNDGDECTAAIDMPFYVPEKAVPTPLAKDERVFGHLGGCLKIDLPGGKKEYVRIAPGTEVVYNMTTGKAVKIFKCKNKIYDELPFDNDIGVHGKDGDDGKEGPEGKPGHDGKDGKDFVVSPALLAQLITASAKANTPAPSATAPASTCTPADERALVAQLQAKGRKKNFEGSACADKWTEFKPSKTVNVVGNIPNGNTSVGSGGYWSQGQWVAGPSTGGSSFSGNNSGGSNYIFRTP
jgi:hypothetical protein